MVKFLVRMKVYFDRARGYISYVQTLVVGLTALKVFGFALAVWMIPVGVVVVLIGCVLVGWVDKRMGVFEAEQRRVSEQNPLLVDILAKVDRTDKVLLALMAGAGRKKKEVPQMADPGFRDAVGIRK
jgi:hypothetical protein